MLVRSAGNRPGRTEGSKNRDALRRRSPAGHRNASRLDRPRRRKDPKKRFRRIDVGPDVRGMGGARAADRPVPALSPHGVGGAGSQRAPPSKRRAGGGGSSRSATLARGGHRTKRRLVPAGFRESQRLLTMTNELQNARRGPSADRFQGPGPISTTAIGFKRHFKAIGRRESYPTIFRVKLDDFSACGLPWPRCPQFFGFWLRPGSENLGNGSQWAGGLWFRAAKTAAYCSTLYGRRKPTGTKQW